MHTPPTMFFALGSAAAWLAVVALARALRGGPYAMFLSVLLGIHALSSLGVFPHTGAAWPLFVYLQAAVFVHFALLIRPSLRGWLYRAAVSVPGSWFIAAVFLSVPWSIARALGFHPWGAWLPFVLAGAGLVDSLWAAEDERHVWLDDTVVPSLRRHETSGANDARPLRIVQITDPHIGAFMSVASLQAICARAVARDPDLVLLTGDLLTMESQRDPAWLAAALAPLKAVEGRCYACLGNHDHEALETVKTALALNGIALLVDEMTVAETAAGPVEIIGYDFHFRDRAETLRRVTARFPRAGGMPRIAMLHDPGAFHHLPPGSADLVLSGHTHGGQLGLLRLGLRGTVVSALSQVPDHGQWALGTSRLYVHRGTGHYGFPLRIGVPAERSLLNVHGLWRGAATA
ncbi:MAG: putative integral rane protein [Myxococcaceae bacterium]|nr:putative integral rane protein [Myxococcaceae bacterium]